MNVPPLTDSLLELKQASDLVILNQGTVASGAGDLDCLFSVVIVGRAIGGSTKLRE